MVLKTLQRAKLLQDADGGHEKEKKTKVKECIQKGNKNIPTYIVGMRRKTKQK
jgi:hypothetical protein